METPSSMRRVTCSQAFVASQKSKKEDSISISRTNGGNSERSALLDITNDSPIVGLATTGLSEKTPPSSAVKNLVRAKSTPGSGEALLRGQVKTLLQKVEEEAELFVNKAYSGERPPFRVVLGLPGPSPSPAQLLAPTPANTPQVRSLSVLVDGDIAMVSSVGGVNALNINAPIQVAEAVKPEEPALGECLINRALLFDSPEKPEVADSSSSSSVISSTLSYQGSCNIRSYTEKSTEDDSSSAWSVQVNVSVQDDEDIEYFDGEGEDDEESEDVEHYGEESFDDLCVGLSKMTVQEFAGKHTRFVYNSDDEIEGEEEVTKNVSSSPGVLILKGLPAPEGKHLRFQDDEE